MKRAAAEYKNRNIGYFESFFIGMKKYQQKFSIDTFDFYEVITIIFLRF